MIVQANARLAISVSAEYSRETSEVFLQSVVLPLALSDTITIEKLHPNFMDMVHYANHTLYVRDKTIVHEVIKKMKAKYKIKDNFDITIHKTISTGHGLGSGASAAMVVIRAINKLAKLHLSEKELGEFANETKQDVSYFAQNTPGIYDHHKQNLTVLKLKQKFYILLIIHPTIVEKKDVITVYEQSPLPASGNIIKVSESLTSGNLKELGKVVFNDLSPLILAKVPALQGVLDYLAKSKVAASGIGGTGSLVFALSEDKFLLKDIADKYKKENYHTIITKVLEQEEKK